MSGKQLSRDDSQVEEGSRKLDFQWEAHTARLKRAVGTCCPDMSRYVLICDMSNTYTIHVTYQVRGPVVQEGERLAEALLTNHQVLPRTVIMVVILTICNSD